jgi:peptidoglycan/LPS O-acetylase OafA/YrhL
MSGGADIRKYEYLDACRGYAILLVMMAHCFGAFAQQPWPVLRETNLGFKGVQLFFVVSSLTLAMSWQRRSHVDKRPFAAFMARRLFRIAPMYTLAFLFYLVIFPPGARFSWATALTTLTFTNGWTPATMPTADGAWTAVSGGWSIAVEFGFYLLFPLFAIALTTLRRSLFALVALLVVALFADRAAMSFYQPAYGYNAADQFVYYWLPNQLPVFCLGFVTFHLLGHYRGRRFGTEGSALLALVIVLFGALAYVPFTRTPQATPPFVPLHVAASLLFVAFVVILGLSPTSWFTNKAAVALGKVSFSAYLLHFVFIERTARLFGADAGGVRAILYGAGTSAVVVLLTFVAASLTYRFVEEPMMRLGHRVAESTNR